MKPARFEYAAPRDIAHALALLASGGADARFIAGGQSLVPAMAFRLARPSLLVDLGRVASLRGIRAEGDGAVNFGAMTRHADVERSELVRERLPLLHAAMPRIAHPAIRSRGTIGGSLAHADPAGDWPALCLACDAALTLASARGERVLSADDFLKGVYDTALAPGELLASIRFPAWPSGRRWGLEKMTRRHGDFALVGVACTVDRAADSRVTTARIVVYGATDRAVHAARAAAQLVGRKPAEADIDAAARTAAAEIAPRGDLHAPAEYRRELIDTLVRRALRQALGG